MKKLLFILILVFPLSLIFSSCEKEDEGTPPEIPPYESMVIDFSQFPGNQKSGSTDLLLVDQAENSKINLGVAGLVVFVWNTALATTIAVPVATFYASLNQTPTFLGNAKWEWTYDVNVLAATYTARMTGEIRSNDIKWEVYISKAGVGAYEEFKWFEGTSSLNGNSGQWILYYSYEFQEEVLQIDWSRDGEDIGQVKYTYVRENDNEGNPDPANGGYITYGLQDDYYDAYYTIYYYESNTQDFEDVFIEWSTTNYDGHIKAEHWYMDTDWHCWDSQGNDIECTQ